MPTYGNFLCEHAMATVRHKFLLTDYFPVDFSHLSYSLLLTFDIISFGHYSLYNIRTHSVFITFDLLSFCPFIIIHHSMLSIQSGVYYFQPFVLLSLFTIRRIFVLMFLAIQCFFRQPLYPFNILSVDIFVGVGGFSILFYFTYSRQPRIIQFIFSDNRNRHTYVVIVSSK